MAANRLSAWRSGNAKCVASSAATRAPNSGCVFSPVPTAVPPRDGIRSYKRTADFQRENILNCNASKRVGTVSMPLPMVSKHAGIESPNAMNNVVLLCYVPFNKQYGPTCTSNAQSINEH